MRELDRPPEITGDDRATEMIRVWLAHNALHVSMLLGMWQDAKDCDIDERTAWGCLLADLTKHIANGLHQSHGWPKDQTIAAIRQEYLEKLMDESAEVEGGYTGEN